MPPATRASRADEIVLLHGDEAYLVQEEARRILGEWRKALVSDFGYDPMDSGAMNAARLRDALLQAPFLDPYRVVAVRGIQARRADPLAPALAQVPETTRLLLTVTGRLSAAGKLVKAVAAAGGRVAEHAPLKARALQDWVGRRARELGLPPNAGALVARSVRPDLGVLDSELRKLASYQAGGNRLDAAVIKELVASDRPEDIFRLTDHILPRPSAEAWRVMAGLLEREQPTSIAWRLARHLALVLEVRAHQDRGESLPTVQSEMREHPFVIQKAFEAARRTPPERLEAGLRALLDYEWKVKSGQVDAELGLQGVLAKL